eukprot:6186296-Pleurochrysis_carterae.AAC.3
MQSRRGRDSGHSDRPSFGEDEAWAREIGQLSAASVVELVQWSCAFDAAACSYLSVICGP